MQKKRMFVSLETYNRRIHEGTLRYSVDSRTMISLQQPPIMPWDADWKTWLPVQVYNGAILMVRLQENLALLRRTFRATGYPVVFLCTEGVDTHCATVLEDNYRIGCLAAEYLLRLKFRRFAVAAQNLDAGYPDRLKGFEETLSLHNLRTHRVIMQDENRKAPRLVWREYVRRFLRDAEKPLAVFALDDLVGRSILYCCEDAGISVPEQVVVLGVGNDPTICDYADPPMSSVDTNGEQLGWMAAKLLHGLIEGKPRPQKPVIVPPLGVVERRSTEIVGADNPLAMKALRYVWDHLHEQLKTDDIASVVGLTPRNLDRLFLNHFGRTVKKEQTRIRMLRLRELLATGELHAKEIAEAVGFRTQAHMCRVFLKENKMTMKQYCREHDVQITAPWSRPPQGPARLVE